MPVFIRTETVEAYQFEGNWEALAEQMGWTLDRLRDEWPHVDRDYDGTIYSPGRSGYPLLPTILNPGDWVVVRDDKIVSFATESWFDNWERD